MTDEHVPSCPSTMTLERFLDDPAAAPEVESHVAHCRSCAGAIDEIRSNRSLVPRLRTALGQSQAGPPAALSAGPEVSGYEIIEEFQRGGQGIVYRARHLATSRIVALKVLSGGVFATDRQRRRFEREIELVAGLDHPGIVTVYDSGETAAGRPYFSMQFVEGAPLDQWSARAWDAAPPQHALRSILNLFEQICDAVSFAHQHGVIHRDLKPSNILIVEGAEASRHQGTKGSAARLDASAPGCLDAFPKVLDFGLAKPALEEAAALPNVTDEGAFLGTLAYASPEQMQRDPRLVDVRTDVFSLGVILFEMLTGALPFPAEGDLSSIIHAIEHDTPPRPSSRAPRARRSVINDELDRIALKALAKDKDRRYRSAGALRDDIRRYLSGEPIEAKSDSRWYVLRKMVARHAIAIGVTAAFVLVLAAGSASLLVMYQHARDEAEKVTQINLFLEDTLGSVEPSAAGGEVRVRDLLDEAARWIDIALADRPEVEASIRSTLGNSYRNLGAFDEADLHLTEALRTRLELFGEEHPDVAHSLSELALLRRDQGELAEAKALFTRSLDMRRALVGSRSPEVAYTLANLGLLHRDLGEYDEAGNMLRESLDIRRTLYGVTHPDVAMCVHHLATLAAARDDLEESLRLHREALAMRESLLHPHHPDVARSLFDIGRTLLLLDRADEARPFLERCLNLRIDSLGDEHPATLEARDLLQRVQ